MLKYLFWGEANLTKRSWFQDTSLGPVLQSSMFAVQMKINFVYFPINLYRIVFYKLESANKTHRVSFVPLLLPPVTSDKQYIGRGVAEMTFLMLDDI